MGVLVINQVEVSDLLPMHECMQVIETALKTLGGGDAINPLRHGMWLPEKVYSK